jgi:hypothetical protein
MLFLLAASLREKKNTATILNLQNDALVAELFGTEICQ